MVSFGAAGSCFNLDAVLSTYVVVSHAPVDTGPHRPVKGAVKPCTLVDIMVLIENSIIVQRVVT